MKHLLLTVLTVLMACTKSADPAPTAGTPLSTAEAKAALARGVNLSNWFNDYSDVSQYDTRFTADDFTRLHSAGFTYVRLPIGTNVLFQELNPGELNTSHLSQVDHAVKLATDAGLAVVLDGIHNANDTFEKKVATDATFAAAVARYWTALAQYFSKYPTKSMFFELYNEPHAAKAGLAGVTAGWWRTTQLNLLQAVRKATINHYVIVGGEGWNSLTEMLKLGVYNQPNVIYNFHFYDPFLFTHQGASWAGWKPAIDASQVPYPSSPENVAPLVQSASSAELANALQWYGSQRYNVDSLVKWTKRASDFATVNNVLVTCNEFGSYKPYAPRGSRLNWIHDMRTALEQNNIGWAMWEYDEGFGFIDYAGPGRTNAHVDTDVLAALGLQ